jgi:AcrR family transcriptional regulator
MSSTSQRLRRRGARTPAAADPARGRGRPIDADGEATRERCLASALDAFAAHGYAGSSMRAVAARAGLTPGSVYHYFPSKADLYVAALRYALDLAYREYEQAVVGRLTLADEIGAILDRSLEIMKRRPAITDLLLRGNVDWSHPELRGMTRRPPRRVARFHGGVVQRAVERGEVAAAEASMLERLIVTLLWGLSHAGRESDEAGALAVEGLQGLVEGRFGRSAGRRAVATAVRGRLA